MSFLEWICSLLSPALRRDAMRYRYIRDSDPYLFEEMGVGPELDADGVDKVADWAMAGGRK